MNGAHADGRGRPRRPHRYCGFIGADDGHRRPRIKFPSFTRNWLVRENPGRVPIAFGRFDVIVIGASAAALVAWVCAPDTGFAGWALAVGALLQTLRIGRWAGDRTWREPLVLILHVAYAFVPLGFALAAAASFGVLAASAGIHAWTAGAIGVMTLAVMTRASLGHTGQGLVASPMTQIIYLAAVVSALARVGAALDGRSSAYL